jgi:hypothetical protein
MSVKSGWPGGIKFRGEQAAKNRIDVELVSPNDEVMRGVVEHLGALPP